MTTAINLPNVTSGSDVVLTVALADPPVGEASGAPIDLTGRTLAVFDESRAIAGRITAQVTNPTGGELGVRIEGTAPIPRGMYSFRVQINAAGGESIGLPVFNLTVV